MQRVYDFFPSLAARKSNMGNELSGGEQQMLAIGRALMTNPKLLILDEATEGLAPKIRTEIWNCLIKLKQEGQAILIVDKHLNALIEDRRPPCGDRERPRGVDRYVASLERGCDSEAALFTGLTRDPLKKIFQRDDALAVAIDLVLARHNRRSTQRWCRCLVISAAPLAQRRPTGFSQLNACPAQHGMLSNERGPNSSKGTLAHFESVFAGDPSLAALRARN